MCGIDFSSPFAVVRSGEKLTPFASTYLTRATSTTNLFLLATSSNAMCSLTAHARVQCR